MEQETIYQKPKKDIKGLVIWLLIIIIGAIFIFYGYGELEDKYYQDGYDQAILDINMNVFQSLNEYGFIEYDYPLNETNHIRIKLVPQEI